MEYGVEPWPLPTPPPPPQKGQHEDRIRPANRLDSLFLVYFFFVYFFPSSEKGLSRDGLRAARDEIAAALLP